MMNKEGLQQPFFKRIFSQLPILFPMVALFHVALLVLALWSWRDVLNDPAIYWTITGLAVYTVLWFAVCDVRKWAGTAYILLTALCIAAQFLLAKSGLWHDVTEYYFPINALLSFFVLFYYKRLR